MEEDKTLLKTLVDFVGEKKGDAKIEALTWCVFELADQIDKLYKQIKPVPVPNPAYRFMVRFGWELEEIPAIKRDLVTGKVLAHEGDETWTRDLKVAGE